MGVNDRDYMKEDSDVLNVNLLVKRLVKTGVFLVVFLLCLRFPILWIKIPLSLASLFFGIRWVLKPEKKVVRRKAARQGKRAIQKESERREADFRSEDSVVKQLIALDAAGKFGRAKSLIQELDGREFTRAEGQELAVIAGNYFPVQLEPSENGVRFLLV